MIAHLVSGVHGAILAIGESGVWVPVKGLKPGVLQVRGLAKESS
jgi:hypothetical protein